MNRNTGRIFFAGLSISALSLVGVGYAYAAPAPMPTGSSAINSGGASGSAEGEAQTIPDPMESQYTVFYEAPYGPATEVPIRNYATPVASTAENHAALDNFAKVTGAAMTGGGLAGTVAGAAIGCVVGGVATAPTVVFVPAGCVAGAVTGAGIGGVLGTIAVGGPAAVATGVDLAQTYMSAPGTTHWASK